MKSTTVNNAHIALVHLMGKIEDDRIVKSMKLMSSKLGINSLSFVAQSSGMSLRNFNRLFLKSTGLTPKEFLQIKRIEMAKSLLMNSPRTITDISLEVGFNSVSKFIEAFKKIEVKLPSDFRHDSLH